jgi:transcriptional regulator with XRE-family HTH domain
MSQNDEAASAERQGEDFAAWLLRTRRIRGKRPIDLVEAAKARGMKLSTGQITNWEKRRNPPAPESARLMAELLDADPLEALRAAGHEDWVKFAESQRGERSNASAKMDSDQEFIARLRLSRDPQMQEIADRFEQDLERARRMARIELEQIDRQHSEETV